VCVCLNTVLGYMNRREVAKYPIKDHANPSFLASMHTWPLLLAKSTMVMTIHAL
jgi:hypothetical protein